MQQKLINAVGSQPWLHRYPRGTPILLFVLIAATAILSALSIERAQYRSTRSELDRNVTEAGAALQRRVAESSVILTAAAAYFESRNGVNAQDFAQFALRMHGEGSRSGSLGIGWAPYIAARDAPAFELMVRRIGNPDFQIRPWPEPEQGYATPILFLAPVNEANLRALGFDMYSDPVRREALHKAIKRGAPVVSGIVRLAQNKAGDQSVGFLIYMPVYRTEGERRYLSGFVYSPFRGEQFLAAASSLFADRPFETAIYDGKVDDDHLIASIPLPGRNNLTEDRRVEVAGRTWILRVSVKEPDLLSPFSTVILVFGLLLALTVAIIARLIIGQAEEDRAVLAVLTQDSAVRDSLTRELNHRVKNTLANVLSILALTRRTASGLDEFAQDLGDRIRALSATHDLLSESGWRDASIEDIVRRELAPYISSDGQRVQASGPDIRLAPRESMSLGLALHELATNAAKYGAFSRPEGRVTLSWRLRAPDMAEIEWQERGGPPVAETERRGFGRDLIEKIVAQELQSEVDLRFNPEGVECRLLVPVRKLGAFSLRAAGRTAGPTAGLRPADRRTRS